MNFDRSHPDDSRRNFVKKSLAASIIAVQPTILADLLRAQGGGGGTDTGTTDPWGTTDPGATTSETTYDVGTTDNETTAPTPKKKIYTSTLYWDGSAWVKDVNSRKFYGPSPLPARIPAPAQPPTGFWQPTSSDSNAQNPPSWINTVGIQWVGDWGVTWNPTPGSAPTGGLVPGGGALAAPVAAEYEVPGQGWYWTLKWTITYEYSN